MIRSLTAKSKSCFRSKMTRSYELFFSLGSCFASHSSSMECRMRETWTLHP